MPSSVIIALVAGGTLNSSAANLRTAVNGVHSGTLRTLKGSLGSDVNVILNVTLDVSFARETQKGPSGKQWFRFQRYGSLVSALEKWRLLFHLAAC